MKNTYRLEQICDYWRQQAIKFNDSPKASWSDQMVIEMEIREIIRYLNNGEKVLDIGCANGYSTMQFASQKKISIKGIDYIQEMITVARKRLSPLKSKLLGKAEFNVGDITALKERNNSYDKVIVIRVLINLGEWKNQLKGLLECARVLKKGGVLLLSEATLQGWDRLNKIRREWCLEDIPIPPFNNYLDQHKVIKSAASAGLEFKEILNFSSTYYIGTRLLKPLLVKALRGNINVADPDMEWNRWFAQLPSGGDYGTQKLFVFKKK